MKLISRIKMVDGKTFQPIIQVVLDISIEEIQDLRAKYDVNEFEQVVKDMLFNAVINE